MFFLIFFFQGRFLRGRRRRCLSSLLSTFCMYLLTALQ